MKKLLLLLPEGLTLACAQAETGGDPWRTVILIALGVSSVVLLILFGRPNAKRKQKSEKE